MEIDERLNTLEDKIDAIYVSVEKTRKYIFITLVITLVMIALPIVIAAFILPTALNSVGSVYGI